MRTAPGSPLAIAIAAAALACGGDDGAGPDAGPGPDASSVDAAPAGACDQPAVTASIGAEGGALALCGGKMTVPPGVLEAPIEFGIAPADAPEVTAPRVAAGPALRFTPDNEALPAAVQIALPHGGAEGRLELFAVTPDGLYGVEACEVDDETIGQEVSLLATFVATVDPYPYPDGPTGLGSGTVDTVLGERVDAWSLPTDGFAIDEAYADGAIALTLQLERSFEDAFEQLRLVAAIEGDAGELTYAQWYDSTEGTIWQLGTPEAPGTTGALELEAASGGVVRGTATGSLYAGEDAIGFEATFAIEVEYFAYPPERFCGEAPKGDG